MATTSSRALALLSLLQTGGLRSGPDLTRRLGISARTLRRDVDTLRDLGYPVHAVRGPDGGYRLGSGAVLPPLLFDDAQAIAVALALQTAPGTVTGFADDAARALASLTRVMPPRLRSQVDGLRVTVLRNYWAFAAPPITPDALTPVGNAVRAGHVLRVELLRTDGTRPEPGDDDFTGPEPIEPHHLVLWAGRWYVVAHRPDRDIGPRVGRDGPPRDRSPHDDWLVHRVDRLHPLAPTGVAFTRRTVPGDDVAALVGSRHDRGDTAQDWPCQGTVLIDLPADVVARWAPAGAVVEPVTARRSRFTVGAWSWAGVVGILATFDACVEGPDALRSAFAQVAERLARAGRPRGRTADPGRPHHDTA